MVEIYANKTQRDYVKETGTTTTYITMSQFKLRLGSPEAYDGSSDFEVWLRRLLSYLNLNNQRYNIIAQHFLDYGPDTHTMEQLALFYDVDHHSENHTVGAEYLAAPCSIHDCRSPKVHLIQLRGLHWATMGDDAPPPAATTLEATLHPLPDSDHLLRLRGPLFGMLSASAQRHRRLRATGSHIFVTHHYR